MEFGDSRQRTHTDGPFSREEVRLANRNSGTPLEALRHDVTPVGLHYLLNHFDVPYVPDAEGWSVSIGGEVVRPSEVSLGEIRRAPSKTLRVTMECAGNGRANHAPRWPSQPWIDGAVATSEWIGTPLRPFLDRAGLKPTAKNIVFSGIDRGFDASEHDYERSLSCDMALSEDVLLVYAMNGQPLLPQHGFPLRLVVPGWYGMASVKWLARITAIDHAFEGHQQVGTYVYRTTRDEPGVPVTTMRVKSLMVPPGIPDWYTRTRVVDAGTVVVHGRAWSGDGAPITRVEFACDGEWRDVALEPTHASPYAWRAWHATWQATRGDHVLGCRATDANGQVQPDVAPWDVGGFGNNAPQAVEVKVR